MHHVFIYGFICWTNKMAALKLWYHSIALRTCEDDISGSAICHLLEIYFSLMHRYS